jgi:hypothetical protein
MGYLSGTAEPAPAGNYSSHGKRYKPRAHSFAMPTSLVSGTWAEAAIRFRYSFDQKTSPSPVLDVDLVDDHERRVYGLVQDVEKKLPHALDQLCLLWRVTLVYPGSVPSRVI